jgi:hypothetical protein
MRCAYAPGNGSPQFETWDPGGQQLPAYRTLRQVAAGKLGVRQHLLSLSLEQGALGMNSCGFVPESNEDEKS